MIIGEVTLREFFISIMLETEPVVQCKLLGGIIHSSQKSRFTDRHNKQTKKYIHAHICYLKKTKKNPKQEAEDWTLGHFLTLHVIHWGECDQLGKPVLLLL